ncbi:MAG TPA: SPOR domain-containing protein [Acetobacteraceae bacterium]|nr:SPOR domain-containing protein [Acetobacteraceae bacterium]
MSSDELEIPAPVYRPSRPQAGLDPATRRLLLIAGGLGAGLLLIVAGWSLSGHQHSGVPVIEPQSGPVRVKPENPGGMQPSGLKEDVFAGSGSGTGAELAPPPETPQPQTLHEEMQEAKRAEALRPATAPSGNAPHAAASVPPATRTAAAPPAVSHAPPVSAPAPVASRETPATPAATTRTATPAAGMTRVQLAALGSEQAARTEWQRLSRRMPHLLDGRSPEILRYDHDGHVFWRLRTGGFADIAAATVFCEHVRSKGGDCTIASF